MIIISNKPGQLCNLIIVYANFLALKFEYGIKIFNPAFHAYKNYFTGSHENSSGKRMFSAINFIAKVLYRLRIKNRLISSVFIGGDKKMSLEVPQNKELNSNLLFVQGWQFRNNDLLNKHKNAIKEFFTPTPTYQGEIQKFIQRIRQDKKTIVGLHIRRGDYQFFENGRYFYSFEIYQQILEKAASLFPGKSLRFLICTNEPDIEKKIIATGKDIVFGPGHELTDLYSLAQCDYLIGPPSTFTMWASFYGNVPLYMIKSPDKKFSLSDFKVISEF